MLSRVFPSSGLVVVVVVICLSWAAVPPADWLFRLSFFTLSRNFDCFQYPEDPEEQEQKFYCNMPALSADTTFIANPFQQSTGPLPAREDYPGPFRFSVLLDATPSSLSKNKWAVSKSTFSFTEKLAFQKMINR